VENDPDNWWYSPFETDVSGAYKLTAPDAATGAGTGVGAGTAVTRASAYERGSYFVAFSHGTGIECSDNSNFNWSLTGQPDQGMCIDIVAGSSSMRAQTQSSNSLSQGECTGSAQRWITRATAFSPSNVVPGTHTNYVLEGCAQDCTTPTDLATKNMRQVSDGSDGLSYKNFDKNIQCLAGFNAPAPGASGSPSNVQDYLSTGIGVPAQVCGQPGSPYVVGNGCTANCEAESGIWQRSPGYNLSAWEASVNNNDEALASFGVDHWSSEFSGDLLTCNPGYTRTESNAFLHKCTQPGYHVQISAGDDDTGCIADCRADPESEAKIYDSTGASTEAQAPLIITGPGTTGALETSTFPYRVPPSDTPALFTCPPDYEPGPGAMPSDANGVTVYSTPRYEHCGKLPGAYDNQWSAASVFTKATRKNYAVTGCYPTCDRETKICLNYTARKPITYNGDNINRQTADSWRSEMGAALTAADPLLSPDNISYVRTQVLNNSDATAAPQLVSEQIYEWQFKCSKEICSMTGDDGTKINLTDLLGPDGIPATPPPSPWVIGRPYANCAAVCGELGRTPDTDAQNENWAQEVTAGTIGDYVGMATFWQGGTVIEGGAACSTVIPPDTGLNQTVPLLHNISGTLYTCSYPDPDAADPQERPIAGYINSQTGSTVATGEQNLCKCTV